MGLTPLQFLHRIYPYGDRNHDRYGHISRDIENGKPPAKRPVQVGASLGASWIILERCWERDPAKRSAAALVGADLISLRAEVLWSEGNPDADIDLSLRRAIVRIVP